MTTVRVAADVGGTFTDVVLCGPDGRATVCKVPSSPEGFERAVLDGVAQALAQRGAAPSSVALVLHATTAGTNAILERRGPLTALVTTSGFRDVLEIGRLRTPAIYDLDWRKPPPLVPRALRLEVTERMGPDGSVVTDLDLAPLAPAVDAAVDQGAVSVAVSLVNAYANPAHEDAVASFVLDRHPGVFVTTATAVVREIGEYERTSTAVCNAYLRPVLSAYLERLHARLRAIGADASVLVMQSSGGMMPLDAAARLPVHLCESGPAAGVLAAASVARAIGCRQAISFDMGGTTAKASLIEDFTPLMASELSIGSAVSAASRLLRGDGYAVRLPVVDLAEVGAGGGSIARVDAGGALVVGPASAGAVPGPACYDKGGTAATVTDANLVLGYLSTDRLVASGIQVAPDRAARALEMDVGSPLDLSVAEAALAVHQVADQQMARALRAVSTERGRTLGAYTLIAFGGSGGLHAASVAAAVGIPRVVVPPLAGVLSTVGLLGAPVELTATESLVVTLTSATFTETTLLRDVVWRLATEQRRLMEKTMASGSVRVAPAGDAGPDDRGSPITVLVHLDVRYAGENGELAILLTPDDMARLDGEVFERVAGQFRRQHLDEFGHGGSGAIEVVRVRVTARFSLVSGDGGHGVADGGLGLADGGLGDGGLGVADGGLGDGGSSGGSFRTCRFDDGPHDVPVRARSSIVGRLSGPLLVDEDDTTTVVPPGWTAAVDAGGNLVLEREQ